MTDALHDRYRPHLWEHVIGQDAAIKMLRSVIKRRESHAYLLCGPAGVGKTTLARIAAAELGAVGTGLVEVPAAVYTGVDDMRRLVYSQELTPLDGGSIAYVIDEAHRLSSQAWDSILKAVEEPPPYAYWFFCTTNPGKVPQTIQTRCVKVTLKPIPDNVLDTLLAEVCAEEGISLSPDVNSLVVREAHGSARTLLVNLAACRDAASKREAAEVLHTVADDEPVIKLCRYLASGKFGSWSNAMGYVERVADEDPESVRIIASNYFGKALLGAKSDEDACRFLALLQHFSEPYRQSEGRAALLQSIGRVVFAG